MAVSLAASSSIPHTFLSPSSSPSSLRLRSSNRGGGGGAKITRIVCCSSRFTALATVEKNAVEKETLDASQFVEVGVVVRKHGVRGELLVRSSTDFPQERFEKPGKRWMKISIRGEDRIEPVELVSGRNRPGKLPCWLITLKNVDSVEMASNYIGATMLVKSDERPVLEEGDFYVPDLIGMDVFVQSSMENIGTIADMCNFGASDLLRVKRNPSSSVGDGPLIWIPFVETIVPVVDMEQRRVIVDPPEGLLELNTPTKRKEKSEARREEVRAMRKLQVRKSGLKKSLAKCNQSHLLAGLSVGEQDERDILLKELLTIDFKSLQESFIKASERSKTNECRLSGFSELPELHLVSEQEIAKPFRKRGLDLIASNRVAVASLIRPSDDQSLNEQRSRLAHHAQHLRDTEKQATLEYPGDDDCRIPWFICTSPGITEQIRLLLEREEYFGLQPTQVCVIAVDENPCFDIITHQILRQSPWKIVQSVTGDGGIVKALTSEGLVAEFAEKGLDYIQVLGDLASPSQARLADPVFFGFADTKQSDLSIQAVKRQASMDLIGFRELKNDGGGDDETSSSGYELVRRYACSDNVDLELQNAASPIGNYIVSVQFAKKLQDDGFNFELHTTSARTMPVYREIDQTCELVKDSRVIALESSLLDCIVKCEPAKISILKT